MFEIKEIIGDTYLVYDTATRELEKVNKSEIIKAKSLGIKLYRNRLLKMKMLMKSGDSYTDEDGCVYRLTKFGSLVLDDIKESDNGQLYIDQSVDFINPVVISKLGKKIKLLGGSGVVSFNLLFANSSLTSIDLSDFYFDSMSDMSSAFSDCIDLKEIIFRNPNFSKLKLLSEAFINCNSLESDIDFSNCDFSNLEEMHLCFCNCSSLRRINLSNINAFKLKTIHTCFSGCSRLEELNLSNFRADNLSSIKYLFGNCSSLKHLNLSSFNSKIKTMSSAFYGCRLLEDLDLSGLDLSELGFAKNTFVKCKNLRHLKINNVDMSKLNISSLSEVAGSDTSVKNILRKAWS